MTSAQVVETPVNITTTSPSWHHSHPDDQTTQMMEIPGFKPFTVLQLFAAFGACRYKISPCLHNHVSRPMLPSQTDHLPRYKRQLPLLFPTQIREQTTGFKSMHIGSNNYNLLLTLWQCVTILSQLKKSDSDYVIINFPTPS